MHTPTENNLLLVLIASITGLFGINAENIDLWLSIILKFVSIVSFLVVIVINLPKFIQVFKKPKIK